MQYRQVRQMDIQLHGDAAQMQATSFAENASTSIGRGREQ